MIFFKLKEQLIFKKLKNVVEYISKSNMIKTNSKKISKITPSEYKK